MKIREANEEDIRQLVELRMQLFAEIGELTSSDVIAELREATQSFFADAAKNQARTWVVEVDGVVAATGTLAFFIRPPYIGNLSGREAYLLNMYTVPAHRHSGLASELLCTIMNFARSDGLGKVWLHASEDGRRLYEKAGFVPNPSEMEWSPAKA